MNDDDATLEIGYSPDQIMKDARGNVGIDYSYRIIKSEQYTKLKARVRDGVVETEQADIHMPQIAWFYNQTRDAFFRQGRLRVVPNPDGTAAGLVGGYRDFRDLYTQNVFAQSGGVQGVREHEDHVALYYACGATPTACSTQDRPLRRHLQRVSHEAGAGFCRGPRQADGYSFQGERGRAQESL